MFDLFYKKNDNTNLFKYLEKNGFSAPQNYIPLYSRFFDLDKNNYSNINLNNRYSINQITHRENNNNFTIQVTDGKTDTTHSCESFFKFSPLLDPIKFMVGKYKDMDQPSISSLPSISLDICCKKVKDYNNSAYVDSFFSYLSSKLVTNSGFVHGTKFFGSFLSIQTNFQINVYDDLEYLYDSPYFHKQNNLLFKLDDIDEKNLFSDTRNYRKKIILDNSEDIDLECETINNDIFEGMFKLTTENLKIHEISLQEEYSVDVNKTNDKSAKKSDSTCSSRSSNTDEDCEDNTDDDSNDEEDTSDEENSMSNSQMSEYSSMDTENELINATVLNFPIQIICLEKLENTLDSLLEDEENELTDNEWKSCLFQIIMTLITYQKIFNFTHNDLHTNNVMYITTDKTFLNYKFNNTYYRVPTFGKIFKIIDFGRAIYSYKGKTICSDSYHSKGDAATQYNFEPYFDEKKPRLEANKSFDLCRLGCSLFDYFIEDIDEQKDCKNPITNLIIEWTKDDKGRNILYKNDGEERYPEFKLYKMIVRTVHNHTPEKQLENPIFKHFLSSKKKIKKQKIINIDNMSSMIM
uniref:Protein kinase domain-containing protein n=1 Tax=viral metagenome TaxID=1070528 RepID=A0A6C0J973_9ZZZZ